MANLPAARPGLVILVVGALLIALSPIFVRLSELGPTATAFHRAFLALPVLFAWTALENGGTHSNESKSRRSSRRDVWLLVLAGIFFAGDLVTWHWSVTLTSVANAPCSPTLHRFSSPSALGWCSASGITPLFLVALLIAFFGTTMVVGSSFELDRAHILGDGIGVVTGMFWAAYQLTVKHLRSRLSAATIMAWSSLVTACGASAAGCRVR